MAFPQLEEIQYLSATQFKVATLEIHGVETQVNVAEVRNASKPIYKRGLIATSSTHPGILLGYARLNRESPLAVNDTKLMDLARLQTNPDFYQQGIGDLLLETSKGVVKVTDRRLVVFPFSTYSEDPMDTEALRAYYKKRGFRELTPREIEHYTKKQNGAYFTSALWENGFQPETGTWVEVKDDRALNYEDRRKIAKIPFDERWALVEKLFTRKDSSAELSDMLATHKHVVQGHLVEEDFALERVA